MIKPMRFYTKGKRLSKSIKKKNSINKTTSVDDIVNLMTNFYI